MRLLLAAMLLTSCTVDLGEAPSTPPECRPPLATFKDIIWNEAIANPARSCVAMNGCHSQESGRSALRLLPNPITDEDFRTNYSVIIRFLNCGTPGASALITKPEAGIDPHLGGDLWVCDTDCQPIRTVEAWINAR